MRSAIRLVVSIPDQSLGVFRGSRRIRRFPVSTAAKGTGFENGSYRTPTGRFRICEKIGDGQPAGTIFRARVPAGLWRPGESMDEDLILTRILRLVGLDPENANTFERCIYVHGTNREDLIGQPASHGCIRLANADMAELFEMVPTGAFLTVTELPQSLQPPPGGGAGDPISLPNHDNFVLAALLPDSSLNSVMSTKSKKAPTGVRYSDAQKQEIVNFVSQYNSEKGRGGQSAAAKKYNVTPLTIAAWLKASGGKGKTKAPAKAAKAAKQPKAPKPAKAAKDPSANKKGMRYSAEQKQEVVDFVVDYNAANGRGGQSHAAKKFNLSVLTVSSWLKKLGAKASGPKSLKAAPAPAALNAKFASLIEVSDQLRKAESEAEKLRVKYDALRASIQALL
jgi:lipoprotein-anchoring transpeptidase ErfK/SrfK